MRLEELQNAVVINLKIMFKKWRRPAIAAVGMMSAPAELTLLLIGAFPTEDRHRNVV